MNAVISKERYLRTNKGEQELHTPTAGLSLNQRKLLRWADGETSLAEMARRLAEGHQVEVHKVTRDLEKLQGAHLIDGTLVPISFPVTSPTATVAKEADHDAIPLVELPPADSYKNKIAMMASGVVAVAIVGVVLFHQSANKLDATKSQADASEIDTNDAVSTSGTTVVNPARWAATALPKPSNTPPPESKPALPAKSTVPIAAVTTSHAVTAAMPPSQERGSPIISPPVSEPSSAIATREVPKVEPGQAALLAIKPIQHRVLLSEQPEFPPEAIRDDVESGTVRAQIEVDANGKVISVQILEAHPSRIFNRTVVAALSKWRYQSEGEPFSLDTTIRFRSN